MPRKGLLLLTLLTLGALAAPLSLGIWQLERRAWKSGLIAKIGTRAKGEPVPLRRAMQIWRETGEIEYYRVTLEGRFQHGQERHLYALHNTEQGWRIITPLQTEDGALVLVDRGFVPHALKEAQSRRASLIGGKARLTGLARAPEVKSWFLPENEAAANRWFWRDLQGMAASIYAQDAASMARLAPFYIEAEAAPAPAGWPKGGVTRLQLPNRHLEYALTWFGVALALLGVYAFFVGSRLRRA